MLAITSASLRSWPVRRNRRPSSNRSCSPSFSWRWLRVTHQSLLPPPKRGIPSFTRERQLECDWRRRAHNKHDDIMTRCDVTMATPEWWGTHATTLLRFITFRRWPVYVQIWRDLQASARQRRRFRIVLCLSLGKVPSLHRCIYYKHNKKICK